MVFLKPSFELLKIKWDNSPLKLRSSFKVGDVLILENPLYHEEVFLNQKKMTPIEAKDKRYLFGVIGLHLGPSVYIHGRNKKVTRPNLFSHPSEIYFFESREIQYPNTKKPPTQLRIPASTWSQMDQSVQDQKMQERQKIQNLLSNYGEDLLIHCWDLPLHSRINSQFASPRTLPNGFSYFHTGVDLRAAVGTPIPAPSKGKVVFADKMIVPGNNIVLDHGGGLFSRYFHLDKIQVFEGQTVSQNDVLGLAGATGRVEGPHLHWEVIWKGNHANPLSFVQDWEQICGPG